MDGRHLIWAALLFIIQDKLAEGQLVDVCASCHRNAKCEQKLDGSGLICNCMYGFVGNGRILCHDKDECHFGAESVCGPHTFCQNTHGSYMCTCVPGYIPSVNKTSFIPNDGSHCKEVDCGPTPPRKGAAVLSSNGSSYGSVARWGCRDGFLWRRGENTSRCGGTGAWSVPSLECEEVDCGPTPPRKGAAVLSSNGSSYGSVARWGCRDGFLWRRGENTSRCGGTGAWSVPSLECEEVSCGNPPVLPHTVRLWNGSSSPGTIVFYSCNTGFHEDKIDLKRGAYAATNMSVCNIHGHWTGANISCKEVSCGNPPVLPHTVRLWNGSSSPGTIVFYSCNTGFHEDKIDLKRGAHAAAKMSVCNIHGHWTGANISCKEVSCGNPPVLPHTVRLWNGSSSPGTIVFYSCNTGFHEDKIDLKRGAYAAANMSVCNIHGHWTEANISCKEVSCGNPPVLPHTVRLWNGSSSPGTIVFYSCNAGFHEDKIDLRRGAYAAANMSVCNIHGHWTGANISCKEVSCGNPPVLPHTVRLWNGSSSPGTIVFYSCNTGFHEDKIDLKRGAYAAANMSVCNIHGHWTGANISCKEVSCGNPPVLPHTVRLWNGSSSPGTIVFYSCNTGFHEDKIDPKRGAHAAANMSMCNIHGHWTGANISCKAVDCGMPPDVPHAVALWGMVSAPGSSVFYECEHGYRSVGGGNLFICSPSGEWIHTGLLCQATCGPVPRLARAEVVWSDLSMAMHRCVDGYRSLSGSYLSVCPSTGVWQQATLRCTEVKPAMYDLQVFDERCLRWRANKFEVDKVIYKVEYKGTREYQAAFRHERKQLLPSLNESVVICLSLLPATNYTVSVSVLSSRFTSNVSTNTSLQAPKVPLITYRELDTTTTLTLTLQRSAHTLDAISVYQVFVVPLDGTTVFNCKSRASPEYSPEGLALYVAGQFPLRHVAATQMDFTVGDGLHHGGSFNAPLRREMDYYIILRVASRWLEGFQSSCVIWGKVKGRPTSYVMRNTSLCAVGVVGALLLVVLLKYGYNRFSNRVAL